MERNQWTINHAGGSRYSIQNVLFKNFIRTPAFPKAGEDVYATLTPFWWKIIVVSDGQYQYVSLGFYPNAKDPYSSS